MKSRAFIAAPLMGTLIFLIAILTIINMSRAEASAVNEIVSETYHNRLVSTVEIYRSDMGSLFNIGIQRNIEHALASQCWQNFVDIATERRGGAAAGSTTPYHGTTISLDGNGDALVTEEEEKLYVCARTSDIINQIVCAKQTDYLYGFPSWARILAEETSFEGITLEVANVDAFLQLINFVEGGSENLCNQLLRGAELDCREYAASGNMRCCSEFDSNGNCVTEIKGCEQGTQFYIRIAVQNEEVFGKFPRVLAKDEAGNRIRAGAITDTDFDAPINYPFFKYLDAAFEFNKYLAFGANKNNDLAGGAGQDVGGRRGVIEGSCVGKSDGIGGSTGCDKLGTPNNFPPTGNYGPTTYADPEVAEKAEAEQFIKNQVKDACAYALTKNLETEFRITGAGGSTGTPCADVVASSTEIDVRNSFNIDHTNCFDGNTCAYIQKLNNEIVFKDTDLTTQVSPAGPNKFCWFSVSEYVSP